MEVFIHNKHMHASNERSLLFLCLLLCARLRQQILHLHKLSLGAETAHFIQQFAHTHIQAFVIDRPFSGSLEPGKMM